MLCYDTFYSPSDEVIKVNRSTVYCPDIIANDNKTDDLFIVLGNSDDSISIINYLKDGLNRKFRFIKDKSGNSLFQITDCNENVIKEYITEYISAVNAEFSDGYELDGTFVQINETEKV